jgi:hypothetical protein
MMPMEAVRQYLSSDLRSPFFLVVGDERYNDVKDEITGLGFGIVRVSDYCDAKDKPPNLDSLRDRLKTADINANDKKLAVVGLGEYLALQGSTETKNVLSGMKELPLGTAKVVLLLRGVAEQVKSLNIKPGLEKLTTFVADDQNCDVSVTFAAPMIGLSGLAGFRALLVKLERGECGNIKVNTVMDLSKSLFTVHHVADAHDGVRFAVRNFDLPRDCGTTEQWKQLLKELNQHGDSLDSVFGQYGFDGDLESDFCARIAGMEYRNWLYFIALRSNADALSNGYLRFVLERTSVFDDFKADVLTAIIDIPHTDKRFSKFYAERKTLTEKFPESDIAYFVVKNRKDTAESIYKLTDNTKTEREEIVAWVSQNGWIPQIADIYPALAAYLKKYLFHCEGLPELSQLLTDYFEAYKRQKVSNTLEEDFLKQVDILAKSHKYKQLPTRSSVIEKLMDKTDTADVFLLWLDALGVEYLAYVSDLAHRRGLSISIHIVRTELPSISTVNNGFYYDDWKGKKDKNETLDDTKHKPDKGYNFENNKLPIHLAKELDIIAEVIGRAATELAFHNFAKILIAVDHGASRLAVLRRKEEKYETDEDSKIKGEYSGRCCKAFEPYDLPFAIKENGYLVLADYGRFRGSRAANVEVHGGASLEEAVIPIIELTLKNAGIKVELVEKSVFVDRNNGIAVTLFSETPLQRVSLVLKGKRYSATVADANHFKVAIPDIKRVEKNPIPAELYAGDDLIGAVRIVTQSKIDGSDFDKLFEF